MNALIICHAGRGMGLGHLTRSLVVARALHRELGFNVQLLIQGEKIERADLNTFKHHFLELTGNLLQKARSLIKQIDAKVIVFDLYPRLLPENMREFLATVRWEDRKIISIDGLTDFQDNLDLLFIPSFQPAILPNDDAPNNVVWGWDCFLLNVRRQPTLWQAGRQVLVLTGGSDATGLGKTFPSQLSAALPQEIELHWVIGPYSQKPVLPDSLYPSILLHQSPSGLDELMTTTHYAVTIYGVSFFELLYYGVPTVVFSPYGPKDDHELSIIEEAGVALVAADPADAIKKLKNLITDNTLAASLSRQARQKMSIQGGTKFAQAVAALLL